MKRLIVAGLMCISTSAFADYTDYKTCQAMASGIAVGREMVVTGAKTEAEVRRDFKINKDDLGGKITLNMWISTESPSLSSRKDYYIASMERCLKLMRYLTVYGPDNSDFLFELNYQILER